MSVQGEELASPAPGDGRHRLPGFLIIGAMKSGTTGLYDDLATHPRTYMPRHKEPDVLHKGANDADVVALYAKHFQGAGTGQLLGEASTMYTMTPWFADVSGLARRVLGDRVRIIYVMREPLKRIISHLAHDYASGRLQSADFDRALREETRYLAISDYAAQLAPWVAAFGAERIHCIRFEDYVADRERVVSGAAAFLGLDPAELRVGSQVSNPRGAARANRFGLVARVKESAVYRYGLARLMPDAARRAAKALFEYKREPVKVELSADSRAYVSEYFADLGQRLADLGVGRFEW